MLLDRKTLAGIADGSITLAFRRWRRPTVKAGGTLLTAIGQLAIEALDAVDPDQISAVDAAAAGYADAAALRAELRRRPVGTIYRVRLSLAGPDPRSALRAALPGAAELDGLVARLARLDKAVGQPWTRAVLMVIRDRPAERAGDLAPALALPLLEFKTRVRRLKALGLTESLPVGYRLSPRGAAVLARLTDGGGGGRS